MSDGALACGQLGSDAQLTIVVGRRLEDSFSYGHSNGTRADARSDTRFDDLLGDCLQSTRVRFVVPFINGEVEAVRSVDLNV